MMIRILTLFFVVSLVSGKTNFEECLQENGLLLSRDICLPNVYNDMLTKTKGVSIWERIVKDFFFLAWNPNSG